MSQPTMSRGTGRCAAGAQRRGGDRVAPRPPSTAGISAALSTGRPGTRALGSPLEQQAPKKDVGQFRPPRISGTVCCHLHSVTDPVDGTQRSSLASACTSLLTPRGTAGLRSRLGGGSGPGLSPVRGVKPSVPWRWGHGSWHIPRTGLPPRAVGRERDLPSAESPGFASGSASPAQVQAAHGAVGWRPPRGWRDGPCSVAAFGLLCGSSTRLFLEPALF
ncbi:uncharacterized protein LOC119866543 isoform X2 [Canis lupus familiaris]|uniref:uncharacterized protein LOC119866543 isoform X2 n=1 Tax=Canis lupus familiaris TaxID=9615 RepID=UPI0018F48A1E|nr:uncharacterized protein LOC119866543 isoform X2 [Canis lupus familiaris]